MWWHSILPAKLFQHVHVQHVQVYRCRSERDRLRTCIVTPLHQSPTHAHRKQ